MTNQALSERSARASELKVFQADDGRYFVESSKGRICYQVTGSNGSKICSCGDFSRNIAHDPDFMCKHIVAVAQTNGNAQRISNLNLFRPKLNEKFIMTVSKKDFVKYEGLLDLAHQTGLRRVYVEPLQFPTKDNGMEAICRATVETLSGEIFSELGDANPKNVNSFIAQHLLRMAATRAKARALRDMTNIGMTCMDELADTADSESMTPKQTERPARNEKKSEPQQRPSQSSPQKQAAETAKEPVQSPSPPETQQNPKQTAQNSPSPKTQMNQKVNGDSRPKLSTAQRNAISNLAGRRKIGEEELNRMASEAFGSEVDFLTPQEASSFIRDLQAA